MTREQFYARFQTRPLSHSQLESFKYSKSEWFDRYITGRVTPPNILMKLGSEVGDAIGTPACPIGLNPPGVKEFKLDASLGPIKIVGYADHFCPQTLVLNENKTTDNPRKWNAESVRKHRQFDMYALMLFLKHDIAPHDVTMYLNDIRTERYYIPHSAFETQPDYMLNEHIADEAVRLKSPIEWYQIPTKRTADDLKRYTSYVERTVERMFEVALELAPATKQELAPPLASSSTRVSTG